MSSDPPLSNSALTRSTSCERSNSENITGKYNYKNGYISRSVSLDPIGRMSTRSETPLDFTEGETLSASKFPLGLANFCNIAFLAKPTEIIYTNEDTVLM